MDELLTWLRDVLQQRWNLVYDVQSKVSEMGHRPDFDEDERALARIEAEQAILRQRDTYQALIDRQALTVEGTEQHEWMVEGLNDALAKIAYGHRFDWSGYDPAWAELADIHASGGE